MVALEIVLQQSLCSRLVNGQTAFALQLFKDILQFQEEAGGEAVVVPLGLQVQSNEVLQSMSMSQRLLSHICLRRALTARQDGAPAQTWSTTTLCPSHMRGMRFGLSA